MPEYSDTLYKVSKEDLSKLFFLKKKSRFEKSASFDAFVLSDSSAEKFLTKLKTNLDQFSSGTRFQLAIQDSGHWFFVDCFIKDGIFHSLTWDAGVLHETLIPFLNRLNQLFPQGKHYAFNRPANEIGIQASNYHCQTFVREQVGIISKKNPEELYDLLEKYACSPIPHTNVKTITIKYLRKEMAGLAPLFRSMQSYQNLHRLPSEFNTEIVSHSKGKNLTAWINENKDHDLDDVNGVLRAKNISITKKDKKYYKELQSFSHLVRHDRAGFGFVSLPQLSKLKTVYQNMCKEDFSAVLTSLVRTLETAPAYTMRFSLFRIQAKNYELTQQVIFALRNLQQKLEKQANVDTIWFSFNELINLYAAELDKENSVRTFNLLKNFFQQESLRFSDVSNPNLNIRVSSGPAT